MNGAAVGTIVPNYDKMFSQAPKGLLCKALVHAVRLLYHKSKLNKMDFYDIF